MADVSAIRELRLMGWLLRDLSDAFGTCQSNVSAITTGKHYKHGPRVLSEKKRQAAIRNFAIASERNRLRPKLRVAMVCRFCGGGFVVKPSAAKKIFYCSKRCASADYVTRMRGDNNPNWRDAGKKTCETCGETFKSYNKTRRFCDLNCTWSSEDYMARMLTRKDKNHNQIVAILESHGLFTRDLSKAGSGIPDLLVWGFGAWHLVEIKNPENSYGKRGLSKRQTRWAEGWNGGPVYLIRADEEAHRFGRGELHTIECFPKRLAVVI